MAAFLAGTVTLAGCRSGTTSILPSPTPSGGTFTIGVPTAPVGLDPFDASDGETFRVTRQIFEGLLSFRPGTGAVAPGLATEWSSTPDGLTWTFQLRDGVRFQDGTSFDAQAVCDNFSRMSAQGRSATSATTASYWLSTFGGVGSTTSLYRGCTTHGARSVVISLTRPTSRFPGVLALPAFAMQSPSALRTHRASDVTVTGGVVRYPPYAREHPTGTGPFRYAGRDDTAGTLTLERNPDYWGPPPGPDRVVFRVLPTESARRAALADGSIRAYDFPDPSTWDELRRSGAVVHVRPAFNVLYLGLHPATNPKLKDLRVRQAIRYALDRPRIVAEQLPPGTVVASQLMPPDVPGYDPTLTPPAHDPAAARRLLAEAGATGMTLDVSYPTRASRPYLPDPASVAAAVRRDLSAVGLKVRLVGIPWTTYVPTVDSGRAAVYLYGLTGDQLNADTFLGSMFGSVANRFGTRAYPWGPRLANDVAAADAIRDEPARIARYQAISREIVTDDLPAIPIAHVPPALVTAASVDGLVPSPLLDEHFASVSLH